MRILSKADALGRLRAHTEQLLAHGTECVMCALVRRGGTHAIAQNEHGVVLLDEFGSRRGHLLVIAKAHVEGVLDLSFAVFSELQRLVFEACHVLEGVIAPRRVYVAALGSANPLPMSYPHYHIHVVPVCEDDERSRPAAVFSWSEGVIEYEHDEAPLLSRELREAWGRGIVSSSSG